jgi:hypothetical protein
MSKRESSRMKSSCSFDVLDMRNYFNNMPRKNANENVANRNVVHQHDYPNRKHKKISLARQLRNFHEQKNCFSCHLNVINVSRLIF